MKNKRLILVVTHRRSGTHWVIDSLRNNLPDVEDRFYNLDRISLRHHKHIPITEFSAKMSKSSKHLLLKSHMTADLTPFDPEAREFVSELVQNSKVIYVFRDGRDVLVSLYHYMKQFRDDLPSFSAFIKMRNDCDPYYDSVNRIEYWREHVAGWIGKPGLDITTVSYERLHSDYENAVKELSDFLDLQIKPDGIERIELKKYGLFRKLLRKVMPESAKSSAVVPRKGVVGDWKNDFSQQDLELYNNIAGDLMKELRYY